MYIYLCGQKRGVTKLECIWQVILTGECPKIISSPDFLVNFYFNFYFFLFKENFFTKFIDFQDFPGPALIFQDFQSWKFFLNSLFIHSLILHYVFTNSCNNLPTQPYSTQNISLTFTHPISTLLTSLPPPPPHPPPFTQQNKQTNKQTKKKRTR